MPEIDFESKDVVWVAGSVYCKTPAALDLVLGKLEEIGYEVKDERKEGYSVKRGEVTVERMEQNGWSLWYASLPDIQKGKCRSCNSYISTKGIRSHGHKCEVCGEVTYRKLVTGSTVTFVFLDQERSIFGPKLKMEVVKWEDDYLYLKQEFLGQYDVVTGEKALEYLALNADRWDLVDEDGEKLYKIFYANSPFVGPDDVISMYDTCGHEFNHDIVKVWEGKEYAEFFDRLPIPESISIYETWHWAPLQSSPDLHNRIIRAAGQVTDAGYYYQDGRQAWSKGNYLEMGKFIRHFTTLDADLFDEQSKRFRLDGPGGIADMAKFCHPDAVVTNKPNIFNFISAVSKGASGQRVTEGELEAAMLAAGDPEVRDMVGALAAPRNVVAEMPKMPRRLKKAVVKPLSQRTHRERQKVSAFLARQRQRV